MTVASRAPSIHNTQPWRWQLRTDGSLLLLADYSRQLAVADPDRHSLRISCGAAGALTELALQAAGHRVEVERLPDGPNAEVLVRYLPAGRMEADPGLAERVDAALRRRSDRRPFTTAQVQPDLVEALRRVGTAGAVNVDFPMRDDQRVDLAVAVSWADRVERDDAAYRAEMQRWLRDTNVHNGEHADGVVLEAVPRVTQGHPRRSDLPLRDFEIGVTGRQLIEQDVDERPLIAVLLTNADTAAEQLAAGEAMMRLMLEAELQGLATCPLSQAVDLAAFRTRLRSVMEWVGYPQIMLRIGYPAGPEPTTQTPRRPVSDLLTVADGG